LGLGRPPRKSSRVQVEHAFFAGVIKFSIRRRRPTILRSRRRFACKLFTNIKKTKAGFVLALCLV
jgi:hypothetical protein